MIHHAWAELKRTCADISAPGSTFSLDGSDTSFNQACSWRYARSGGLLRCCGFSKISVSACYYTGCIQPAYSGFAA